MMRTADSKENGVLGVTEEVMLVLGEGGNRAAVPMQFVVLAGVQDQYTVLMGKPVFKFLNATIVPDDDSFFYRTDAGTRASLPISHRNRNPPLSASSFVFNSASTAVDCSCCDLDPGPPASPGSPSIDELPDLANFTPEQLMLWMQRRNPDYPYNFQDFYSAALKAARLENDPPARHVAQLKLSAQRL